MGSFADEVKKWEKKTADKLDLATRQIALQIFARIVLKSPVDSGRFRGNWQVAIGSAPTGTDDAAEFPAGDAVDVKGPIYYAKMTAAEATMFGANAGDIIYFANNLPYAQRLEGGYSQQAPAGMVALTVQEFQSIVAAIGIELSFT